MLIGSTFAWFTDTVTTGNNTIATGNLKVGLEYSKDMSSWTDAESKTTIFDPYAKWEPGHVEVVYFKVTNLGELAFNYEIGTKIVNNVIGKNQSGEDIDITTALKFGIVETGAAFANRDEAVAAIEEPLDFSDVYYAGNSLNAQNEAATFAMVVWLPVDVNDDYNHDGKNTPSVTFGVQVIASQKPYEKDSFDEKYDIDSEYPSAGRPDGIVATPVTAEELMDVLQTAFDQQAYNGTITINLENDFDLDNNWTTVGYEGYGTNNVVINGNGHTIYNLNQPLVEGSFGGSGTVTINDLTISGANISSTNYNGMGVGAFACYYDSNGGITLNNCHLVNSTVTCTDGYAGGLLGYSSADTTITNCSVTGCTINGQKSAGAILGHGAAVQNNGKYITVDGCTVSGCTITETLAGRTDAGAAAIVGRLNGDSTLTLKGTITLTGNTIKQGDACTTEATSVYCANSNAVDTTNATIVDDSTATE